MSVPEISARLKDVHDHKELARVIDSWFQEHFKRFVNDKFHTAGDVSLASNGKGVVMKNSAGTVTKRVRLNDAGDGIYIEDL